MTESKQRIRCACPCGCQGYADLPEDLCHYCLECHEDLRKDFVTAKHFCGSKPVSTKDLRKALDKFRDILLDNDACDHILSEYDSFHDLFSVFQKDNEKVLKDLLLKDLAKYNLLCELQASMISGLRAFKKGEK